MIGSGYGIELHCLNGKPNGKYEGQWYDGYVQGCGVFTWPSGMKTMCRYDRGLLVSEQSYTLEAQANQLLSQKMDEWEKEKATKEANLDIQLLQQKEKAEQDILKQKQEAERLLNQLLEQKEKVEQEIVKLKLEFEKEKQLLIKFQEQQGHVKLNVGGND